VCIFNYRFTISVSILCLSNPLCLSAFRIFVFLYKRNLEVFFVERRLRFLHRGGGGAVEEGDGLFCLSSSIVTMATETVVLKVAMTCEGCVGAVKRAIAKLNGVDSYNIDLKEQKVSVTGNVKPDEVLDRISRTGKTTTFWPKDDKGEAVAA